MSTTRVEHVAHGWTLAVQTGPISGADVLDQLAASLSFTSLPEMVFGANSLVIGAGAVRLRFCAADALVHCTQALNTEDAPVRVIHAAQWDTIVSDVAPLVAVNDWTWTTM